MAEVMLATQCTTNGVNENWTDACALRLKLILSRCQFKSSRDWLSRRNGTDRRKREDRTNGREEL